MRLEHIEYTYIWIFHSLCSLLICHFLTFASILSLSNSVPFHMCNEGWHWICLNLISIFLPLGIRDCIRVCRYLICSHLSLFFTARDHFLSSRLLIIDTHNSISASFTNKNTGAPTAFFTTPCQCSHQLWHIHHSNNLLLIVSFLLPSSPLS